MSRVGTKHSTQPMTTYVGLETLTRKRKTIVQVTSPGLTTPQPRSERVSHHSGKYKGEVVIRLIQQEFNVYKQIKLFLSVSSLFSVLKAIITFQKAK